MGEKVENYPLTSANAAELRLYSCLVVRVKGQEAAHVHHVMAMSV